MALDFSDTKFNYVLVENAPVYKANKLNFQSRSKLELETVDENLKPDKLDSKVEQAQSSFVTVYFRNPNDLKLTQSALSKESISLLSSKFSSTDFYKRDDGSFILNGEAENFVSAWWADIAYKRGYLKADENQDGFMSKEELDKTKSGFGTSGFFMKDGGKILVATANSVRSYIELGSSYFVNGKHVKFSSASHSLYSEGKYAANTIALELDKSIKNDKNFDFVISFSEALSPKEMEQDAKDGIIYSLNNQGFEIPEYYTLLDLLMQDKESLDVFSKLAKNGFDMSKLSDSEKELIKNHLNLIAKPNTDEKNTKTKNEDKEAKTINLAV